MGHFVRYFVSIIDGDLLLWCICLSGEMEFGYQFVDSEEQRKDGKRKASVYLPPTMIVDRIVCFLTD